MKFTSSSGIDNFWIVYPLSWITLDVDSIIFVTQYWTIVMYVERTYDFTSEMMILHLTY